MPWFMLGVIYAGVFFVLADRRIYETSIQVSRMKAVLFALRLNEVVRPHGKDAMKMKRAYREFMLSVS